MVPIVLDTSSTNYSHWHGLFLNTLGKYTIANHILSDDVLDDEEWRCMDCTMNSWIYATVSPELLEIIMVLNVTAREVWLCLEQQFLSNQETRALILDIEFQNFVQGDLSVMDYFCWLKAMADALADLGEPVTDQTLVLSVL